MRKNRVFLIFLLINFILCRMYIPFIYAGEQKLLQLDINEVIRLALKSNFDIQIYRLDNSISEKELLKAQDVYDTEIDASFEYDDNRLNRSSTISGSRITSMTQDFSLTKQLPTGTTLSLGASHAREASDSSFSAFGAYHESEANVSITQALSKNALGVIDRNEVKITKLDVENTAYTSIDKIEKELADTQKAYWNLLLANKQLNLTEELLESARSLYATNKKRFDIGLVEEPEFYAVSANLKEKEKNVLLADDNINAALNLIRLKLGLGKDVFIVPKDDFDCEEIGSVFEDVIRVALTKRRDYAAAKNDVKAANLYVEMKKSSRWPQIDLKGTLKKNGLDQKFEKSVNEIISQDYPEYTVEVIFSFSLENSSARAEYSQKELEKVKALVSLKKTECLILVEAHDAFVHAQTAYNSSKLLREAASFEHKKFLGEKDRFEKGRSDTDRLIRYQDDYLGAQLRYHRSLYGYKAALIDLRVAMNILLEEKSQ